MSIVVVSNEKPAVEPANAKPAEAKVEASTETTTPAPAAKTAEQKEEVEASEAAATEVKEETEESETLEGVETKEGQEGQPPKKKGGFQRRIDKLNARVTAKEQEAEYWKQQALKAPPATETKPAVEGAKPAATEGKPDPEKFETHAEYVEALSDWKVDQKLKERDQKDQRSKIDSEQAKAANSYAERAKAFAEKTTDYQDVLAEVDHVPLSPAVKEIILKSEHGPELAYELAKDPEEFARVCKLPALEAALAIGELKSRLTPKTAGGEATKKTTKAPAPLAPVRGSGGSSAPKTLQEAADSSYADYKKLREAELNKRRQA